MNLLVPSSPTDVPRFIVPVVVDSVKSMFWGWLRAELQNKLLERSKFELDSSAAIILIMAMSRIYTAISCPQKGVEFIFILTARMPMNKALMIFSLDTTASRPHLYVKIF